MGSNIQDVKDANIDTTLAIGANNELKESKFNSCRKTEKELNKIIADITKDNSVNLKKLEKLKLIKDCYEQHTDNFFILLLLMNFSNKCLDIIIDEVSESLQELTIIIFEKYDFCPETIQEFNAILYDESGFLSQERKIIKEAINLEIIERRKLYLATKNKLEEKILLASAYELINTW